MDLLLSIFGFTFASAASPGPNNLMVLASGANWGYWRTLPHILGITIGFPLMVVAVGLGLGAVFDRFPQLLVVLKVASFAYLLYLAWRLANADRPATEGGGGKPLSFLGAAAFQWINPKGWAMALASIPLFVTPTGNHVVEILRVAIAFAIVCLPSLTVWCLFGRVIAGLLADDRWRRRFNWTMAALLVVSVVPALI